MSELRLEKLDGDFIVEAGMPAFPDLRHPAFAKPVDKDVLIQYEARFHATAAAEIFYITPKRRSRNLLACNFDFKALDIESLGIVR